VTFERVVTRPLTVLFSTVLCLILVSALFPVAAVAAPGGKVREYIVALSVADTGQVIQPSSRSARQRISRRADRVKGATVRLTREHGFKARHRFDRAATGFSARMTASQAAEVAGDSNVVSVRLARKFKLSGEVVPRGVKRVLASPSGTAAPDVNAHVAVMDTGIGPVGSDGSPIAMGPKGKAELNIAGGINFAEPGAAGFDPSHWGDTHGHGTHVSGIIGARDNNVGVVGVAPGVRLWAVRVFGGSTGSEAAILCGLDWIIATHSNPTPDIDVINMSFEGPRADDLEDCDAILANAGADPIHKGVCTATRMGITVVAAAGNSHGVANNESPGGYDQVISVGALADFDGVGGGESASAPCSDGSGQRDDAYATWSNYGSDIDIMAPGVCIQSTWPTASGQATFSMSGTSQAAPHVTGAVARWLAQTPGTNTARMRRLVRASGRMDWDPKSDKFWSGVSDADPPNRVLDVKALMGGKRAKVWLYNDGFTVAGSDTARSTRVDIQRRGGYNGMVNLKVKGLPSGVGSASFGQSSLEYLTGLGTRLTLNLKTGGPDGIYDLGVRATGSGVDAFTRPLRLKVDRTGPVTSNLTPRVRGASTALGTNGEVRARLRWSVNDALSAVQNAKLQRKIGSGTWKDTGSPVVPIKPSQQNRFRVKATDNLGNVSFSKVAYARLRVRDSKSSFWTVPKSDWRAKSAASAYGGSLLLARGRTSSLKTTFNGKAVAVIGSLGPGRGWFRVRLDGGAWTTVKLKASNTAHRRVVWSRTMAYGRHTLAIQGVSGQSAIDAMPFIQ